MKCEICECNFWSISELEIHTKSYHKKVMLENKLKEIEHKVMVQKLQLSLKVTKLKEKDVKRNSACNCRSYCRIFHPKHNWRRSLSDDILSKLKDPVENVNFAI